MAFEKYVKAVLKKIRKTAGMWWLGTRPLSGCHGKNGPCAER